MLTCTISKLEWEQEESKKCYSFIVSALLRNISICKIFFVVDVCKDLKMSLFSYFSLSAIQISEPKKKCLFRGQWYITQIFTPWICVCPLVLRTHFCCMQMASGIKVGHFAQWVVDCGDISPKLQSWMQQFYVCIFVALGPLKHDP